MINNQLLAGKVALITGAGRNIGKGIAQELAAQGADIIFTDVAESRCIALEQELSQYSVKVKGFVSDVSQPGASTILIDFLIQNGINIDILVNNVGIQFATSSITQLNLEEWHQTFNTNVFGPMYLTKLIATLMLENSIQGSIIFVTSMHQAETIGWASYSASKAALGMIVKELAIDLGRFGIRVNGIAPGWVAEDDQGDVKPDQAVPLQSSINPCYIGRAAVYLASEYFSKFTTGTTMTIDAGASTISCRTLREPPVVHSNLMPAVANQTPQPTLTTSTPLSVYQPPHVQQWLLQAALMQKQPALQAWQQWRNQVDIETLDADSHHLLSLLYFNLTAHQVEDPYMGRLKGVYRRTWYANQLLIQQFKAVVQAFQDSQIEVLALREMATILTCYPDYGHRPIYQFDVMLRSGQTPAAINHLQQLGWTTHAHKPQPGERLWQPLSFQNASYFQLNLHNHLFWATPQTYTDEQLWTKAIATQINGISTLALSPVDQLLYLCLKLNQKQGQRPIYWLADAAMIINAITDEAEWVRLVTQAQRYEMVLPLRYLLVELQELLQMTLPDWVIPNLRRMAISYHELLEYDLSPDNKLLQLKALFVRLRQQSIRLFTSRRLSI